jgi:hypothetical protein
LFLYLLEDNVNPPADFGAAASSRRMQAQLTDVEQIIKQRQVEKVPALHRSQILLTHIDTALTMGALLHKLEGNERLSETHFSAENRMLESYTNKVKRYVARQELSHQRKLTEVNVDAMHRFIEHAVPDLTSDQKQELKHVRRSYIPHTQLQH